MAEKKEQAKAIIKTQNPIARGEEARINERERAIKSDEEQKKSIWEERSRT